MNSSKKKQVSNSFGGAEVLLGIKKEVLFIAMPFLEYLNTLSPEKLEQYKNQFECLKDNNE